MPARAQLKKEVLDGLFEQGLMGIEIPTEHGGTGSSFMTAILAIEELAKVDPAVSVCCDVHNTLINNIMRVRPAAAHTRDRARSRPATAPPQLYASDELQAQYLPRLATDMVGSFCLSEPGSGSDAFALQARADPSPDGSYYTLSGQKLWVRAFCAPWVPAAHRGGPHPARPLPRSPTPWRRASS